MVAEGVGRLQVLAGDGTGGLFRKSFAATGADGRTSAAGPRATSWGRRRSLVRGRPPRRRRDRGVHRASAVPDPDQRSWSAWTDRGRSGWPPAGPARITSPAPGRLEVVARDGVTNDLLRWSFNGNWTGPVRVAATPGGAFTPSIVSWSPSRLDVFAVTEHQAGWHIPQCRCRLEPLGEPRRRAYGQATAVAPASRGGSTSSLARSDGRALRHRWFDGTRWLGPETLAAGTGPDRIPLRGLAAAAWAPGRSTCSSTDARTHNLAHSGTTGGGTGRASTSPGSALTVLADPDPRSAPAPSRSTRGSLTCPATNLLSSGRRRAASASRPRRSASTSYRSARGGAGEHGARGEPSAADPVHLGARRRRPRSAPRSLRPAARAR